MQNKLNETLAQRGGRYGDFSGHARITQTLKDYIRVELQAAGKSLPAVHQEALDMIFHKIGRIINGDHDYDDSWRDIAGYATLVERDIEKRANCAN